jgi:hypothetical protein
VTAVLSHAQAPSPEGVLTRAFVRATEILGVPQKDVGKILGISPASASRLLTQHTRSIKPDSKEGELAILFLRMFRSLDALLDGDLAGSRAWLRAENQHLGGVPLTLTHSVEGLVHVIEYLDAMRGKI